MLNLLAFETHFSYPIVNILELNHLTEDKSILLNYLKKTSIELDQITRSISSSLHSGISVYEENKGNKTENAQKHKCSKNYLS
jgi:hypothetical protein